MENLGLPTVAPAIIFLELYTFGLVSRMYVRNLGLPTVAPAIIFFWSCIPLG